MQKIILPILVIITFVGASLSSAQIDNWYFSLNKAPLNPPGYVFGIVWPILYFLMAIVSYRNYKIISMPFIIQLFLNGIWSWLFFAWHLPAIALLDILLLIGVNIFILKELRTGDRLLYLPYLLWLGFATYLNAGIVILN
ncbi:MAG: TspO/MBR family protein [Gammaproteobacteria bacterium]